MATVLNVSAEAMECSVCFEIYCNAHILRCGHTFCKVCIDQVSVNNRIVCPTCRKVTASNDVTKDYIIIKLIENLQVNRPKEKEEAKSKDC
jgi:hypothetical protein